MSEDRARVYRALAGLFQPHLSADLPELEAALVRLGAEDALVESAREVAALVAGADPARLQRSYRESFEADGGLRCPPNEMSHTADTPQEGLTRTFEMADVAGFYRAFGVEVAPGGERPDHVAAELEFMHLLAVKEMIAHDEKDAQDEQNGAEHVDVCRDAARAFLRDHLGRWAHRLAARLEEIEADPAHVAAGRLLDGFVAHDAASLTPRRFE